MKNALTDREKVLLAASIDARLCELMKANEELYRSIQAGAGITIAGHVPFDAKTKKATAERIDNLREIEEYFALARKFEIEELLTKIYEPF